MSVEEPPWLFSESTFPLSSAFCTPRAPPRLNIQTIRPESRISLPATTLQASKGTRPITRPFRALSLVRRQLSALRRTAHPRGSSSRQSRTDCAMRAEARVHWVEEQVRGMGTRTRRVMPGRIRRAMFLAEVGATPVYRLLGKTGLQTEELPVCPWGRRSSRIRIGFRQHPFGHTPAPNWPTFFEFADHYLHASARP